MDEANRLLRRPPVRPGDAGDADRDVCVRVFVSAPSAIARAVSSLTAPCLRSVSAGTPSSSCFGLVGIDDKAALEHVDEPGISASSPAMSPPVHDSAVAAIRPAARYWAMSAAARAE